MRVARALGWRRSGCGIRDDGEECRLAGGAKSYADDSQRIDSQLPSTHDRGLFISTESS
jgi:hypothetical protein